MLVSELVAEALTLSNVVSAGLQVETSDQTNRGLALLNLILAEKAGTLNDLPYYDRYEFAGVIGQEEYFIPYMSTLETLTCIGNTPDNEFRYAMSPIMRKQYWGANRAQNINSSPSPSYYIERGIHPITFEPGMKIFVYFFPSDNNYEFQAVGKFRLDPVQLATNLNHYLDLFYQSYLIFKLGKRLAMFYQLPFDAGKERELINLEQMVNQVNAVDTTIQKISAFKKPQMGYWGYINYARGWSPR